jgi:hypothetical protein
LACSRENISPCFCVDFDCLSFPDGVEPHVHSSYTRFPLHICFAAKKAQKQAASQRPSCSCCKSGARNSSSFSRCLQLTSKHSVGIRIKMYPALMVLLFWRVGCPVDLSGKSSPGTRSIRLLRAQRLELQSLQGGTGFGFRPFASQRISPCNCSLGHCGPSYSCTCCKDIAASIQD